MERRRFILGIFALSAGAVAAGIGKAQAAPAAQAADPVRGAAPASAVSTLPDGAAVEQAQYRRYPRYRRYSRRRRQVCTVRRDRYGRPVRICHWVSY